MDLKVLAILFVLFKHLKRVHVSWFSQMSLLGRAFGTRAGAPAWSKCSRLVFLNTANPHYQMIVAVRSASTEGSSTPPRQDKPRKPASELTSGEHRSYLEEVFIKREEEPKTTAQKGTLSIEDNKHRKCDERTN